MTFPQRDGSHTRCTDGAHTMTVPRKVEHADISFLVPSYNSMPYIMACIESALAQRGPSIEILVQDGGSTDGTLSALAELDDPRLQVISERDAGQSDALNRALDRATGEFVMWLNADDLLLDGAASAYLHARLANKTSGLCTGATRLSMLMALSSRGIRLRHSIGHGSFIMARTFSPASMRRHMLVRAGGFDAKLHYCMDYDLLFRIAREQPRAASIPQAVAQFRRQPDSKSESAWLPFLREWLTVGRRHGANNMNAVRTIVMFTTYRALRPLWRSNIWLHVRPNKHLGGT